MEKTQAAPKRQAKPKAAPPAPPPEVAEEPPFEAGADGEEQREAADPSGEMESSRRKKDMFWMALVMNTVSGEVDMIRFKTPAQMKAWFAENPEWKLRANEIIRGYFKPVVTKQTFTF